MRTGLMLSFLLPLVLAGCNSRSEATRSEAGKTDAKGVAKTDADETSDLAARARTRIAPSIAALNTQAADAPTSCPGELASALIVLSEADAGRLDAVPESILSALLEAKVHAIDRELERRPPIVDEQAQTFESGKFRGEIIVFSEAKAVCRLPWSAINDKRIELSTEHWTTKGAALTTLTKQLEAAAARSRQATVFHGLGATVTEPR